MKFQNTLVAFLMVATVALAQDPPSRVARLSLLEGPVSFQPESVNDWTGATLNYPLTTGDHLYSDMGARAELRLGPNAIRIAQQTSFGFLNLDDQTVQIRLTEGSLIVRVRSLGDQDVWEVDTPNGAVSLLRTGEYRIDTDPNRNATMVTVRSGEAEVTANGQSFPVRSRQTAYFTGDGRQEGLQDANPPDDFDRFSSDRDRRDDSTPAPRYVSQQMVGYEDLDRYGSWDPSDDNGPVWRPRVSAGWAPYHEGHWAWRDPWGWTWIDDAPWGFAPFHYGRWAHSRAGWGWYPGPVVSRPVYAPALVAFVGGGGFSLSTGGGRGGGVGWFPLGPREVYRPAYHASQRYERELNGRDYNNYTVNRNVTNIYINRNAPGAFSAVSRQDFVSSRAVQRSAFRNSQDQFRSAQVSGFSPGLAPQRESLFGRSQGGTVVRPRDAVLNREVIARTPPPAASVTFESRQQAIRENQGRPLAPEQINSLRGNQNNMRQPVVRSAISPNQGFGRNAGTVPGTYNAPGNGNFGVTPSQAQPDVAPRVRGNGRRQDQVNITPQQPVPQENRGFCRNAQPQQAEPQTMPQAVPQPNTMPDGRVNRRQQQQMNQPADVPQQNRGFGRNASPQQADPQAVPPAAPPAVPQPTATPEDRRNRRQQQQTAPPADAPPPNRGFGRSARPEFSAPPQNVPMETRPPAQASPPPNVPQENRGFGRNSQRQAAPPPEPQAPRNDNPAPNRGFGRAAQPSQPDAQPAQRVERPAERPAENRGFGRASRPDAEKPKDEKPKPQ